MRKNQVQKISAIINESLENTALGKNLKAHKIIQSWEKVLGKNISEKTRKIKIYNKTLYVEVSSSVIKHYLLSLHNDILKKLNQEVNEKIIDKIIITNK